MKVLTGTSSFGLSSQEAIDQFRASGVELVLNPYSRKMTKPEIIEMLKDVDGLIAGLEPLDAEVLASAPKLKAIARVGIGMDNVDLKAAQAKGIKVSNTPDGPTEAVAEMALAALLCLSRNLVASSNDLHTGKWEKRLGKGLRGSTVLFIGYGRIARCFSKLLHPFAMRQLVYDPYLSVSSVHALQDLGSHVKQVELAEGLSQADIITLHAAGDIEVLGSQQFAQMKHGVILLNSARGGLINESALLEALDRQIVQAAWLDVFLEEPYKGSLQGRPEVLLTPHNGTYTHECRAAMELAAAKNLLRDLAIKE